MAVDIGPIIGIEGEAEYRKQIQNIIQQQKTLKAEMQATSTAFDKNTTAQEKNAAKAENLSKQIEVQKQRVSELQNMVQQSAQKYGEADTKTLRWKEALANATAQLNRMNAEMRELQPTGIDKATKALEEFSAKCDTASQKWKDFGSAMTTTGRSFSRYVTAPIVAAGTAGVKYISDFDTSMAKVRALAGDASKDVSESVVQMAEETGKAFAQTGDTTADAYSALEVIARQQAETTVYTAGETADALSYMALAGWDVEQMANGLPGVLSLAAASQMDLAEASDIVTDQLTAFHMTAEDAAHFSDVLAQAQAKSNTTTSQMGEALKYVGPVAGQLGYTIEDVAVALGTMANASIKGSMGGTTLRNILTNMANPSNTMAEAMDLLGVSLEDDNGRLYTLAELMQNLRSSFGELSMSTDEMQSQLASLNSALEDGSITEEEYEEKVNALADASLGAASAEKVQAAAMLAGKRGLAGLLAIVSSAPEDYDKLTEAIYNSDGASEQMAATMRDNLEGRLAILKSQLGETAFSFLGTLMPAIERTVDKISAFVERLNSMDEGQRNTLLTIAGIAAAVGPVLITIGKLSTGIGSIVGLVGKLSGAAAALLPVLAGISPVTVAIVAGIAAVIAITVLVVKHWDELKAAAIQIVDALKAKWEEFKQKFTETANNIKTAASGVRDDIRVKFDAIREKINSVGDAIRTKVDAIKDKFTSFRDNVANVAQTVQGKIDNIKSKFDSLREKVSDVIQRIKNAFNFNWQLPHLSLPHISVYWEPAGGLASFLGISSIPHLSVQWYKKAYDNPVLFNSPTIVPTANGLKGFGDGRGGEIVIGRDTMYAMIRDAVASAGDTYGDVNVVVYGAPGQNVEELADIVADRINDSVMRRRAAFA